MANVLINNEKLTNIASAIRGKGNTNLSYTPSAMASAIMAFQKTGYTYNDVAYGTFNDIINGGTITSFERYAFAYTLIREVNFSSCSSINSYAFFQCSNLQKATFSSCTYIAAYAFASCNNLSSISFPNCRTISNAAFANCSSLTTVSFPLATTVGMNAFISCSNLTEVYLPQATKLQDSIFANCKSLSSVTINSNITSFPNQIFYNCITLILSNSIFSKCVSVFSGAFNNCRKLTQLSLPICTLISSQAFYGCSSLSNIYLPECASITGYQAFGYCINLTSINLPKCSTINSYNTFVGCRALSIVSLPICVSLNKDTFNGCLKLVSLYLNQVSTVTTLSGTSVFYSTPIGGYSASAGRYGSVFVPASLYQSFITATNWVAYSSRIVSV